MSWEVVQGDCIERMAQLEEASIDAVVCDPPYGLEFMGKEWDGADGFRRSLNPADVHRDNPFGRASRTSPEYKAGKVFERWCERWAVEALRVLKPGGHLLAFGGTRTYHRLAAGIEDAGFEIRDSLLWLYGSGFPKSLDVSKAIDKAAGAEREVVGEEPDRWTQKGGVLNFATDRPQESVPVTGAPATDEAGEWQGWGTALKPAHEPIVVARKPLIGTVAENVLEHGTGGINIDACRIGTAEQLGRTNHTTSAFVDSANGSREPHARTVAIDNSRGLGRHPANVVLCHLEDCEQVGTREVKGSGSVTGEEPSSKTGTVLGEFASREPFQAYADEDGTETIEAWACAPGCPVAALDEQSGNVKGKVGVRKISDAFRFGPGGKGPRQEFASQAGLGDSGGASRFFYCAKTSRAERNAGLEGFEAKAAGSLDVAKRGDSRVGKVRSDGAVQRQAQPEPSANHHPTVKPNELMRWLVRMVTPPGGLVLDPFLGSGSTGCAAVLEGFDFLGIEREPEYIAIAEARITFWSQHEGREVEDVLQLYSKSTRAAKEHADRGQGDLLAMTVEDVISDIEGRAA